MSEVKPYGTANTKKEEVADMFNNIASNYDFLNHFLSMGIDITWRKKAIRMLKDIQPKVMLDVATGTGDFALEALALNPDSVTGVDISKEMLAVGVQKMKKKGVDNIISMQMGDSENLPFEDNHFDAITVAFGVRNFQDLEKGLSEMCRVMRPGGRTMVIEFSKPESFPIKQLYNFYFMTILPRLGKIISKDPRAYTYLPESVNAFPYGDAFLEVMKRAGYNKVKAVPLTFGIASIYVGEK